MKLESKIIDEIIEMLEGEEGEKLKKHPKLMAMQVEVEKKPMVKEEKEVEMEDEAEEELTPEMIQKLLEMAK